MTNELECLPILVVSAKDEIAAKAIISEVIDNNPQRSSSNNVDYLIWRLVNKYYTADVRLHTLLDGQELDLQFLDSVEAHLIHMSQDECTGADAADVMRRRAQSVAAAQVRVVAADVAEAAPPLVAACSADRLELVPLREAPGDDDVREECGLVRVRAAFHAHVWPGLVRRERGEPVVTESSDSEWSEWCSGPEAEAAHSDLFAAALGALPAAAAAARTAAAAAAAGGAREERLARAEQLVMAFCRALGPPLD